jgi:hypothetical protein
MRIPTLQNPLRDHTPLTLATALPSPTRPLHAIRVVSLGRNGGDTFDLLCAHRRCGGVVYRYAFVFPLLSSVFPIQDSLLTSASSRLLPRHLPSEPVPRLPVTEIRPFGWTGGR